ncbi:endolytic transglycosylase MltG [Thiomicrospira sp. WB1]|uniref:endolytic transglycosylase MltG n=1 Tax=Thiomicrospira sp. WB1 TaxID=1685380 RepID=UPI000748D2E4|nr:endolytic transglycosylase MltG [Thiomicrospira sp. WB1]KUJ72758.1 BCR, YceG family protein [Thiomicrospira sp. WB1]
MNWIKWKLLTITLLLSGLVIWLSVEGWAFRQFLTQPISSLSEPKVVSIASGSSTREVANQLHREKLLRHPDWFVWVMKWEGLDGQIKAGEMEIQPQWDLTTLMDALVQGKTVTYPFTLIAGETLAQALERVQKLEKIEHTLTPLTEQNVAKALDVASPLEGQLLPETYFYSAGETDVALLERAYESLQQRLSQAWAQRAQGLPYDSPYEALILASIVEKESGYAAERAKIAGVFVNRLRRGMRLQSDPTVIYGMGERFDGNIRKQDLRTKTPWNTYRINGLPPTPIALPSGAAIDAVMQPEATDALYFVSKGDGQHYFSETLAEHNRAVRKYILNAP